MPVKLLGGEVNTQELTNILLNMIKVGYMLIIHQIGPGVVYLTPNAPPSGGTGFFKHKEMGLSEAVYKEDGSYDDDTMSQVYQDSQNYDKWEMD